MPLNRIHASKVAQNWIRLLEQDKNVKIKYIPGLNIFPIKEAGWFLGHVDIGFWAAFLYVIGSVFYVMDCFVIFSKLKLEADDDNPSGYGAIFNIVACLIFIANALLCFVDWWLQYKQISISTVGFELNDNSQPIDQQFSYKASFYYFNNNIFFMAAAVVYTVQAFWWVDPNSDFFGCAQSFYCGEFSINFWAAFLYLVSSIFAVLEYFDYCESRKRQGLNPLKMFTSMSSDMFDWFGWGDWFYVLAGAYELWQAMDVIYIHKNDDVYIDSTYLISQSFFLIDSIFYFVGYIFYCLELKNAFNSGVISPDQFKELAKHVLPADQQEEVQGMRRSSLIIRQSLQKERLSSGISFITSGGVTALNDANPLTITENEDFIDGPIDIAEAFEIINAAKETRRSRQSLTNPLLPGLKKNYSGDSLVDSGYRLSSMNNKNTVVASSSSSSGNTTI